MKLYLGNLPFSADETQVRAFFSSFKLDRVIVCTDRDTGWPRGFGFIEIADRNDALHVIETYHGVDFGGRTLVVNEAMEKPKGERQPRTNDRPAKPKFTGGSKRRRDSDYE